MIELLAIIFGGVLAAITIDVATDSKYSDEGADESENDDEYSFKGHSSENDDQSNLPSGSGIIDIKTDISEWINENSDKTIWVDQELKSTIFGGETSDLIFGTDVDDQAFGNGKSDLILGGGGDDFIDGGIGNDLLVGGTGADVIDGGDGDDTIWSEGLDPIASEDGQKSEELAETQNDDVVSSDNAVDDLDLIFGGDGSDVIFLSGSAIATGGNGDDHFHVLHDDHETSTVTDFDPASDRIFIYYSPPDSAPPSITIEKNPVGQSELRVDQEVMLVISGNSEIDASMVTLLPSNFPR